MELSVVILAAGKGTRMKSSLPKVMQPLAGQPLLAHVIQTAVALGAARTIVVHGHGGELVQKAFADTGLCWAEQAQQHGTGHAVAMALPQLPKEGKTLILYGDVPLTSQASLQQMIDAVCNENTLALMTVELANPTGYGRIVRMAGQVQRIVEQKDAHPDELAIKEINTGILCVPNARLHAWLPTLSNDNAQGEYYLTDLIGLAAEAQMHITTVQPAHIWEVEGVNDKVQLSALERVWQHEQATRLMRQGVTLLDPGRFDLRGQVQHGSDVQIDVNVVLEGRVVLGNHVSIGPSCVIKDAVIGDGVEIRAHCVIDGATIGAESIIGPFARLRPGTELAGQVHIGNFVETKKATLGVGSKANHLAYLGDAVIGAKVNIGAGTITCNYDGVNKFQTTIGDDVFIGTNNSLVAPVTIEAGATTGAGSTITKDVPAQQLAIARAQQRNIEGWCRPRKK